MTYLTATRWMQTAALSALLSVPSVVGYAQSTVSTVTVAGNQRVETSTIVRYSGLIAGGEVNDAQLNTAIKQLYDTGFFAEVGIETTAGGVQINVTENPMVNDVRFEGNEHLDADKLSDEVQLRARTIYTRPKAQEDVARILELYRRSGRFSAEVRPTLVQLDQNRVDIVYEVTEGDVTRIGNIEFIGNQYFSDGTLNDAIKTSTECWYCFLTDDDKYDPDRVAYDKELLRRFYMNQGFADFEVKSVVSELSPEKDAFFLTFTVVEGTRYTVSNIAFDTQLPNVKTEELMAALAFEKGELYDAEAVDASVDKLVDIMGDRGFAFVDIDPVLSKRPEEKTLDVTFTMKEGPRVYVERINIEGNMRTLDEVVRREFRIAEGDPYSTSKLQRSEQRLRNLGFFEDVKIGTTQGSAPDRVVVNVTIKEQSTGEVTIGAGYSTADGALADFGIRERNLLGRGQDLRFKGTFAQRRQEFDIGFTEPYFMNRDVAAGFDLFKTTQDLRDESSFDRESIGGRLRFGYSLTENLRQDVYYSYLQSDITNIEPNASRFVRDQVGENTTSLVGQSLTYDKLDNRLEPTEGYLLKGDLDVAGLGGDSKFVRPEGRAQFYHTFVPQWTLMLGGTAGYVYALDDTIKIQDRFFLGGQDIRGFANAGFGPRDTVTTDALGGNIYYTGTSELQFPIGLPEDLGFRGAVFVDAGSLFDVDDTGSEVADDNALRASTGVGLAWKSPFGPVRLDFAKAFLKQDYDIDETFRFSFGTRF
jgi:outer membrane protein insertion porin family